MCGWVKTIIKIVISMHGKHAKWIVGKDNYKVLTGIKVNGQTCGKIRFFLYVFMCGVSRC
jgi:hypothetical protein